MGAANPALLTAAHQEWPGARCPFLLLLSPGATAGDRLLLCFAAVPVSFGSVLQFPAALPVGWGITSCPAAAGVGQKAEEVLRLLQHTEQQTRPQPSCRESAAREEELLLQSHTSYYLPTKGSVCTAGREPEDRDSPADLHRTCSRQARALMSPDRCACRHPCTWPAQREPPGMLPTSLQPLSASKSPRQPPARVGFLSS